MEKNKRRGQVMLYAPLLIWIGVIFFLSSGQGSMTRTSLIVRPILEFLFPSAPEETLIFYHGIIRKFAHFAEYAVLGLLACRAFSGSTKDFLRTHFYLPTMILVVLVAGSDELNQSFNAARTGSYGDALLDLTGGLFATLFYYILTRRRRRATTAPV